MRVFLSKSPVAAVIIAAALTSNPQLAASQARPPQLRAVQDLRIEKGFTTGTRLATVLPGPAGELMVTPLQTVGTIAGFDSTGRPLSWSVSIGGRESELRWVSRMGWSGNTLWVADPGYEQIALIDRAGKVTKSLEYPAWIRPSWADRRKYPVFEGLEALALYSDGTWLVRPTGDEVSLTSAPEYDKNYHYFMRVGENGSIKRVIGRAFRDDPFMEIKSRGTERRVTVPFRGAAVVWNVAADGSRIVIAATSYRGADSATYRVTALGERGDTAFSRKFPYSPVPITKKSVDSSVARFSRTVGDLSPEQVRDLVAKQIPPSYPAVQEVVVGRDKTTWLGLHATGADREWIILDPAGAAIGTVALPKQVTVRAADRNQAWAVESNGENVVAVLRYKIVSGPPPAKKR